MADDKKGDKPKEDAGHGPGNWAGRQPGGIDGANRLATGEQAGHGGPKGGPPDRQG